MSRAKKDKAAADLAAGIEYDYKPRHNSFRLSKKASSTQAPRPIYGGPNRFHAKKSTVCTGPFAQKNRKKNYQSGRELLCGVLDGDG